MYISSRRYARNIAFRDPRGILVSLKFRKIQQTIVRTVDRICVRSDGTQAPDSMRRITLLLRNNSQKYYFFFFNCVCYILLLIATFNYSSNGVCSKIIRLDLTVRPRRRHQSRNAMFSSFWRQIMIR